MPVFAAMGERKPRRIVKPAGRAMDNFGHQRERLQRARPELLQQQQFGKVMQVAFVGDAPAPRRVVSDRHSADARRDAHGIAQMPRAALKVFSGCSRAISSIAFCAGAGLRHQPDS